jgi:hypothetical protein
VPGDAVEERRWWIELDTFIQLVPAGRRMVILRPDELSAVIKKPPDKDPAALPAPRPGDDDDGGSYCQCGWPYTLSMSYCGAADRYPDVRDMGYPFSRPFTRPIADTFLALDNAAGRKLSIRRT